MSVDSLPNSTESQSIESLEDNVSTALGSEARLTSTLQDQSTSRVVLHDQAPRDDQLVGWGNIDPLFDQVAIVAMTSGMMYAAGSLYLRFSKRLRWATPNPRLRRRRAVLGLTSAIFGTSLGLLADQEDMAAEALESPFLLTPCFNLVYYPWDFQQPSEPADSQEKLQLAKEVGRDLLAKDAHLMDIEYTGIAQRIFRQTCHVWSSAEVRAAVDNVLRRSTQESDISPSDRDLAVTQLSTAWEFDTFRKPFRPIRSLFFCSALVQIFSTSQFLLRHTLWMGALSLLPTLCLTFQDYVVCSLHHHLDKPLEMAVIYELAFEGRPPLYEGMKSWESPDDDTQSPIRISVKEVEEPVEPESGDN